MAVFDDQAKTYDDWYKTKFGNFIDKVETDLAFRLFKPEKGMKILDIGCGTGNFSIKLAKMGCEVVGIDVSEEMLKKAEGKAKLEGLDIEFHKMDVYDLDFEDKSFDAVFSMAAFEFIKEPERAIDEMFRVAKEGAQILIGTINRDSKWGELYLSEDFQKNSVFKYAHFKNLEDLKSLKSEKLINSGECLFIPPYAEEDEISIEKENKLSKTEKGGFICALWRK
jgi:ubiquinone biosynthesis O-methyltransferase